MKEKQNFCGTSVQLIFIGETLAHPASISPMITVSCPPSSELSLEVLSRLGVEDSSVDRIFRGHQSVLVFEILQTFVEKRRISFWL